MDNGQRTTDNLTLICCLCPLSLVRCPCLCMKIALTADWLTVFGGAEHVLLEMKKVFPEAPLFTTVTKRNRLGPLAQAGIRTSSLQKLYRIFPNHQWILSLMPRAIESLDLRGFDVILSSSHAVGKGIIPPSDAVHICYCHTPMRYAWEMEEKYLDDFRIPKMLRSPIRRRLKRLRRWDLSTAKRVDVFIANSEETQERIRKIYGRESLLLPPPVDSRFFAHPLPSGEKNYFLALGRLVPYKRFDLLIETANAMQFPLKIVGRGQDEVRLRALAGPTVEFMGFVPDQDLPGLYAGALAILSPQHEDAGIVPMEAQASGTPVIAYDRGGARDTVREGVTGIFFAEQTASALVEAMKRFETQRFDPEKIRAHARQFDASNFRKNLERIVREAVEERVQKK